MMYTVYEIPKTKLYVLLTNPAYNEGMHNLNCSISKVHC